jgi:hypothetical protein
MKLKNKKRIGSVIISGALAAGACTVGDAIGEPPYPDEGDQTGDGDDSGDGDREVVGLPDPQGTGGFGGGGGAGGAGGFIGSIR